MLFPKGGLQNDLIFMFHGILVNVSFLGLGQIRSKKLKSTHRVLAIFIIILLLLLSWSVPNSKYFDYHPSADIPDCPAQQVFTRHQKMLHGVLHTAFI